MKTARTRSRGAAALGERLAQLGLTITDAAGVLGVHQSTVSQYVSGTRTPRNTEADPMQTRIKKAWGIEQEWWSQPAVPPESAEERREQGAAA